VNVDANTKKYGVNFKRVHRLPLPVFPGRSVAATCLIWGQEIVGSSPTDRITYVETA
jgi:hypothetical protein